MSFGKGKRKVQWPSLQNMHTAYRLGRHVRTLAGKFQRVTPKTPRRGRSRGRGRSRSSSSSSSKMTSIVPASNNPVTFTSFFRKRKGVALPKFQRQLMPVRNNRSSDTFSVSSSQREQASNYVPWFIQGHLDEAFDIIDDAAIPSVKGYFKFLKGEIRMTNQMNANVQVVIYDIVNRRDMDSSQPTPLSAWDTGISQSGGSSVTTKGYNNLNCTPFESPLFCQLYKVRKVTKLTLSAGQGHVHKVNLQQNVVMAKYLKDQYVYYKGLSAATIITVNGMPVCSDANDLNIAVSKSDLACVSSRYLEYRAINAQQAYYQYKDNQPAFADPFIMTKDTSGPSAVLQA